jgi:molybdopterin molybdotransferase
MSVAELLSLDEAIATVLRNCRALAREAVPIGRAAGRVLAEGAAAAVDLPPFPASAMDGYAVRAADTPGRLPVAFRIAAGRPATRPLDPGGAMGIATGGVVPDGADAVVPVEETTEADGIVEIARAVKPSANVRPAGRDVVAGTEVAAAGTRLAPAQIAALAAAGLAEVACARRPRVAVLTTGTELRPPGIPLGPGEVYEANGVMLAAQLEAVGAVVELLSAVADDEAAHHEAIARGLEYDVLVTSGGVSVGPHDLVRSVEAELGVEEIFWGVALKPGKPLAFGRRGETLVFGLPGNPVSSLVSCQLFVCPAVLALQGASEPGPKFEVGKLAVDVSRDPRRDALLRARATVGEDGILLSPVEGQESHMIVRASAADALVLVPRGEGFLAARSPTRYVRTV